MKIGKINRQSIAISSFTSVLNNYEGMPSELYSIGSLPKNRPPTVAIVGSRKPTAYGEEVTYQLAYELAKQGVIIISGLAYGVDVIAHKAAMEAGGTTVAVLANGLHRVYPTVHESIAKEIIATGGALISEQSPGVEAHKYHFLARNRLISGLADAIIVTEATDRSGTFSTVAHALTQNKEIFAVPGPITSLLSVGPNRLLQEGAHVALTSRDILEVIAPQHTTTQLSIPLPDTPLEAAILNLIQRGLRDTDSILGQLDIQPSEVLQTLTMMELKGIINSQTSNQWKVG